MAKNTSKPDYRWTRTLLIVAAAIAVLSIGLSIMRQRDRDREAAAARAAASAEARQTAPDIGQMIARLEERLKQDTGSAKGWRFLGISYFQVGRYADAAEAYQKAADLTPDNAELWSAMGEALVMASNQGMPDRAVDAFDKAIAADPKDARARFFIGLAKAGKGDTRHAIDDWFALLKDSPPDAPWVPQVRQKLVEVAAAARIDISARLDALPSPPPAQSASPN